MRDMQSGKPTPNPPPWRWIALNSIGAAAFFFTFNYLALKTSLETSLLWAAVTAVAAAWLAWSQARRM